MFTYTTSKKKLLRTIIIALSAVIAVSIIVMAVISGYKVVAAEKKVPIYSVSRADNRIAVTFDCAWGNSNTELLLELLKDANASATFFVTGEFCDKYPEDVKKMYDAGHEIGNHSDVHPHVEGININDLIEDTRECSRKIKMITGEEPKLYRAPYGEYDDNVVSTVEGMGLKMIQWSVDSIDWQEPDADTIIERVTSKTQSGSILLFHNDLANTAEALPDLLTSLKQKGFSFVKVSDLVYFDSYHIDQNGVQIYDVSALLPAARYSDNYLLDEAMEIFRQNLTLQEIYNLTGGATLQLLERTGPLLDAEHMAAIQEASFEELKEAVENLVTVAEREGAGNGADVTTPSESGNDPANTDADGTGNNPPIGNTGTLNPPVSTPDEYVKGMPAVTPPVTTSAAPTTTAAAREITTPPVTTPAEYIKGAPSVTTPVTTAAAPTTTAAAREITTTPPAATAAEYVKGAASVTPPVTTTAPPATTTTPPVTTTTPPETATPSETLARIAPGTTEEIK